MSDLDQIKHYNTQLAALDKEFSEQSPLFREIAENIMPNRGRYLNNNNPSTEDNKAKKSQNKIINGKAEGAVRVITAGLHGGVTSPSRPWFNLRIPDEDLMKYEPVKEWLTRVRDIMLLVMQRSNFYGSMHSLYYQMVLFGTGAMMIDEDMETVIRCRTLEMGEYRLTLDHLYKPCGMYRRFSMTTQQMIAKFGRDAVSQTVKSMATTDDQQGRTNIIHVIENNYEVDKTKMGPKGMAYRSGYYEESNNLGNFLRKGGFRSKPFIAGRWDVAGVDTWASSWPSSSALGDTKMLQKMEAKKLKALDKMVDPPMNAHPSLKKQGPSIISGAVNYIDPSLGGAQAFQPVYQVRPDLQNIAFELDRVEKRIDNFYFVDLFLAIISQEKDMTAYETAKRYEEKIVMLGPTLERLDTEVLDPGVDRIFDVCYSLGIIPPPPEEMQGMPINVQYTSLLYQAQQMVGSTAIEQVVGFTGMCMKLDPSAGDKVNLDEAIAYYGDSKGCPPRVVRSDDEVAAIRQNRAKQQAAQTAIANAEPATAAVKNLAESPTGDGDENALKQVMAMASGGAQ